MSARATVGSKTIGTLCVLTLRAFKRRNVRSAATFPTCSGDSSLLKVRATENQPGDELPLGEVTPVLDERLVLGLQRLVARQRVDEQVIDYAVRLTRATREWPGLALGAGSRGALALVRGGRAIALMAGRSFVTPDDIKSIALPALRHRVAVAPDAALEGRTPNDLLAAVIDSVPAPRT